jgi:bifunctional DNA-binding transcriptional regulator/antitoxin component of YhaV-PrlF toxin-antitoxin module
MTIPKSLAEALSIKARDSLELEIASSKIQIDLRKTK